MLSAKMKKKMVSLMMCASIFTSTFNSNILAADKQENGTVTSFKANLFDYNRDQMNTATLQMVAEQIQKSNPEKQLSLDELQTNFSALLFNNAGDFGKTSAKYSATTKKVVAEEVEVVEKATLDESKKLKKGNKENEVVEKKKVEEETVEEISEIEETENEEVVENKETEGTSEIEELSQDISQKAETVTKIEKRETVVEEENKYEIFSSDFSKSAKTDYNNNNSRRGTSKPTVYQGLVGDTLANGLPQFNVTTTDLFNVNDSTYKTVYPNMNVDFVYEDGYYVLDSSKYSYSKNGSNINVTQAPSQGFFPLGNGNFWFGMDVAVDFLMPEDGMYDNKECMFEFSGDDDVWVFVDGKLALDLGGIHAASGGIINFANQTVSYKCAVNRNGHIVGSGSTVSFGQLGLNVCDNKTHTLQVFYLERGASVSNCKIKFNMPTINDKLKTDVELTKRSTQDEALLANAGFTLYSDYDCTNAIDKAYSGEDGKIVFDDLKTGIYYLKETDVPVGYEQNNNIYIIQVAGNSEDTLTVAILDENGNMLEDKTIYNTPKAPDVKIDKKVKLKSWIERTYNITLKADAKVTKESALGEIIDSLVEEGNVKDYIDNRFELCDKKDIEKLGGKVGKDSEGVYVIWENVKLENWSVTFPIKAKDTYMGGNYITTNGDESGVLIKDKLYKFPQRRVNVRIILEAGKAEDTIFLGQNLEKYFTDSQMNKVFSMADYDLQDVKIKYNWEENGKTVSGSIEDFKKYVRKQSPEEDCVFEFNVVVSPKVLDSSEKAREAAESMKNDDKTIYTATMATKDSKPSDKGVKATGLYFVFVIGGEITITKHFDTDFLNNIPYTDFEKEAVDAKQSVIYSVYRYAEDENDADILLGKAKAIERYELTITGDGSRTIAGLRAGKYKVVEETDWSWKYILESVNDSYKKTSDGIVYLGIDDNRTQYTQQNVKYENRLDVAKKWLADTTNKLNKLFK